MHCKNRRVLFTRLSCNYYTNTCLHARCSTHTTNFCVMFTHYAGICYTNN